ncbi:hypothetical protein N7528_001439 [Penicillium herquei]|nr:hypothetical protein N7528_001439 [Penicillium herquei]
MKGFVGGIPLALLVAAVQVQAMESSTGNGMSQNNFHQRRTAGFGPQVGGTALGGPSGNDGDGSNAWPYNAEVDAKSNVNEFNKDDHSVKIHNKEVHAPPPPIPYGPALGPGAGPFGHAFGPALGPGAGPFPKRGWPAGGTAEGGPSGNDEGQVFNMPITGNFKTDVNDYNKDDHSISVKNKDIHASPIIVPPPHPHFGGPGGPGGPPGGFREANEGDHFHIPAGAFAKRFAPGGTALGGPGGGDFHGSPGPFIPGGTALGGPSGDDDGGDLNFGKSAHIHTNVNEASKDDHSIDIKHKDIYERPFGVPFKRGFYPEAGGTALGGPSGNDGGQEFNMPITIDTDTAVNESYEDDHSIDLKHKDVYAPPPFPVGGAPFRRAYAPSREEGSDDDFPPVAGGTALGGPSGDDSDGDFNDPTDIGVDTNVNENHQDNHAIKLDTTTVHRPEWAVPVAHVQEVQEVPEMPWMTYEDQQHAAGAPVPVNQVATFDASGPAPPTDRDEHEQSSQCDAVHEVVRTVTKTQYKQVAATKTVYQQAPVVSQAVETSAIPMSAVPNQMEVDPKVMSSAVHGSQFASAPAPAASSFAPYESYNYKSQAPMSSPVAMYSMIPVQVPVASSSYMGSMATPAASMGLNMPSGVSPEHSAMASASASPSSHSPFFTGAATRVSGGLASAAAAVVGVLAFVL